MYFKRLFRKIKKKKSFLNNNFTFKKRFIYHQLIILNNKILLHFKLKIK
jgi:hypothetical protein